MFLCKKRIFTPKARIIVSYLRRRSGQAVKEKDPIAEAMRLHEAGETEKAIDAYKIAIGHHPKDKRLYANLAAITRAIPEISFIEINSVS